MTSPDPYAAALDTVARQVLIDGIRAAMEDGTLWEEYPEIGEHDFTRIENRAIELAGAEPDAVTYLTAYAYLARQAERFGEASP